MEDLDCSETDDVSLCKKFKSCKSCPDNGTCDDEGVLTCKNTYINEGELCVENEHVRF